MKTAVIIPCYRVSSHIINVVEELIEKVDCIYVVDDKCPEASGSMVLSRFSNFPKVKVIFHEENQGVGGAVASGYKAAIQDGYEILIKMDGDGQMDPDYIGVLIAPILHREADYTKGNRFYAIEYLRTMPPIRVFGNSVLSFINKISSGYWNVMDPTNGYTAIHVVALKRIDLDKISKRYFFESDMLFRLNSIRAVVRDVAMPSIYADEESNLKISKVLLDFPKKYIVNFFKRFFYNYILRDLNPASIETLIGSGLLIAGMVYGGYNWAKAEITLAPTPIGTVMLVALMIILGVQFLLAALTYDVSNVPKEPLQTMPGYELDPMLRHHSEKKIF